MPKEENETLKEVKERFLRVFEYNCRNDAEFRAAAKKIIDKKEKEKIDGVRID